MKEITTWPNSTWQSVGVLGEGGYGKVYEIERNEFGKTYKSAMKVMHIPASQSEIDEVLAEGMSRQEAKTYFDSIAMEIISEFALMFDLRGHTNIVSYEDHMVIPHEDGIGCDILIRMELLTPLKKYVRTHPFGDAEIIRLGIDICTALELCRERGIVHRDLKPENIFVSDRGDYNLGDFGIARHMTETVSVMSRKGTYMYMAPEVYYGKPYGMRVDLYSLGMVLYQYMNMGRGPFLPLSGALTAQDKSKAFQRRMSGEALPLPRFGMPELQQMVMKALSFRQEDRFATAGEFKEALIWCRKVMERRRMMAGTAADQGSVKKMQEIMAPVQKKLPAGPGAAPQVLPLAGGVRESVKPDPAGAARLKTEGGKAYETETSVKISVPDQEERRKRALKIPSSLKAVPKPAEEAEEKQTRGPEREEAKSQKAAPEKKAASGVLRCRFLPDQAELFDRMDPGEYPVFGNPEYLHREITRIRVVSSIRKAAEDAWDVSAAGDRSVLCWTQPGEDKSGRTLYIGADGKIRLEPDCSGLFAWFERAGSIELNHVLDFSDAVCLDEMFRGCTHLEEADLTGLRLNQVKSMAGLFRDCTHLKKLTIRDVYTAQLQRVDFMCCGCLKLEKVDLFGLDTGRVRHMEYMFAGCESLQELSLRGLDTSSVVHMENLFSGCRSLWELDLTGFKTDQAIRLDNLFEDCESLTLLDLSSFHTGQAEDMSRMFSGCVSLKRLNLSGFDTSNVVRMTAMFRGCENLTELIVRSFDTRKVTSMEDLFRDCRSLKKLNVGRFETGNVRYMAGMFMNCEKLIQLNVMGFDTRKAWDMSDMFSGCIQLSYLDISGFITTEVEYMDRMFENCRSLPKLDLGGFDLSKVRSREGMTEGCSL